jgi:hypothetical protein
MISMACPDCEFFPSRKSIFVLFRAADVQRTSAKILKYFLWNGFLNRRRVMSGPPTKIIFRHLSDGPALCSAANWATALGSAEVATPAVTLFNIAARARRHNEAGTLHEILVAHSVTFGEELNR